MLPISSKMTIFTSVFAACKRLDTSNRNFCGSATKVLRVSAKSLSKVRNKLDTNFQKLTFMYIMFTRLISSSKSASVGFSWFLNAINLRSHQRRSRFPPIVVSVRKMASNDQQFPPQRQERQPGKEHVMDPLPQFTSHDYTASNKLRGKVALVTGGDSGIGRAVCHCFAQEGATVAFTYVKAQEAKDAHDTLEMLREAKTHDAKEPMAIAADLGYDENCKRVVDEVVNAYGRIDILVNNAAEQYKASSIEEIDEKRLERVFRTNIFSHFFVTRHALKHMKGGSSIINTTSIVAYKGSPQLLDYTATKGAIVAFTRGLAMQVLEKGIRVNGVAPGPIWTPLIPASFSEEETAQFGSEVPMKRAGQPREVAPCYVFLACNHCSSYITGQVLHPNGGVIVNS